MNILIGTSLPFLPERFGGMQSGVDDLTLSLKKRGHKVSLLCGLLYEGRLSIAEVLVGLGKPVIRSRLMLRLLGGKAWCDTSLGYPVWRALYPWEAMEHVVSRVKPDVILLMSGDPVRMTLAARRTNVPSLLKLQNVEFREHGGSFSELGDMPLVANSRFTADCYYRAYGIRSRVIHPLIDREKYATRTTRENVTFINPHDVKGLDIAIALAQHCPEIPFSFVESWHLTDQLRKALELELARTPNIKLLPPTRDMRRVYGLCRILIAPSRWQEAYGRVASEAQCSGIPVVASNRGGLPEAVGPGGILLDPDGPISDWVMAIKRLWHDKTYYSELSAAARAHSERQSLDKTYQLDMWEKALVEAIDFHHQNAQRTEKQDA